ncbi:MAG: hypothetical protein JWR63_1731 [Conexibacter sp.]|nr:hypothetical protein [Conexibacter sp.]
MRSQCKALPFFPPVSGYERPSATYTVPPIFSSKQAACIAGCSYVARTPGNSECDC